MAVADLVNHFQLLCLRMRLDTDIAKVQKQTFNFPSVCVFVAQEGVYRKDAGWLAFIVTLSMIDKILQTRQLDWIDCHLLIVAARNL